MKNARGVSTDHHHSAFTYILTQLSLFNCFTCSLLCVTSSNIRMYWCTLSFVQAPCCQGKPYHCRICHDEQNDHELDRKQVTKVLCRYCRTEQEVSGVLYMQWVVVL